MCTKQFNKFKKLANNLDKAELKVVQKWTIWWSVSFVIGIGITWLMYKVLPYDFVPLTIFIGELILLSSGFCAYVGYAELYWRRRENILNRKEKG